MSFPLPLPRPLPPDRLPARLALRLDDGYETPVYEHRGGGAGRLPVVYAHGIQSHPGWFVGSAAALAEAGHPVYQVTRRGSGENVADRGDAASAARLLRDLGAACALARQRTGAARVHLLGASWGGKLVAAYAADLARRAGPAALAGQIASLTMVAPGIASRVDVPAATKLAIASCALLAPRARFAIPLDDAELFTDSEPMRQYLRGDRFALHRATARFLLASRRLDRLLRRAAAGALSLPVTLILAERDRIIDNDATLAAVRGLAGEALSVRVLSTAHVPEFEDDPRPLYAALVEALARAEGAG